MITVAQALDAVLALATPTNIETVPLSQADGRVLAEDAVAARAQPPFAASAMDGYAVARENVSPGDRFSVIGESAAGHGYDGAISGDDTVRIFTGAPLPKGGKRVIIQEDVTRDGDIITLGDKLDKGLHIRPAGGDFKVGDKLAAPHVLTPADIALLASMNVAQVRVRRRPVVAILATGDELVSPGEAPRADQIIASNNYGLAAMVTRAGATARVLPIAKDTTASLEMALELAAGADMLVTIGGASVGDHDIVGQVAETKGLEREFYKVAMRPGKPLMAGRIDAMAMIGLPGNPVSSMVCGEIFLRPLIDAFLGLPTGPRARVTRVLAADLGANGPREHYMRAVLDGDSVKVFERQDSSLLTVLAAANALVVRRPNDPSRPAGTPVEVILL